MIYHNLTFCFYLEIGQVMTDQEFLKQLGKSISTCRKAKGMSQLDLCAIINMEKSNLSAIENGRQNVTSLTLKKIASALSTDLIVSFENP